MGKLISFTTMTWKDMYVVNFIPLLYVYFRAFMLDFDVAWRATPYTIFHALLVCGICDDKWKVMMNIEKRLYIPSLWYKSCLFCVYDCLATEKYRSIFSEIMAWNIFQQSYAICPKNMYCDHVNKWIYSKCQIATIRFNGMHDFEIPL